MAEYADAAVIVWDGTSRGSKHMINQMSLLRKPYYVHVFVTDDFMKDEE
jgi:hypothetical protein